MNQQSRLTAKDLINIGIYSVLYFFIMIVIGFLGFIPPFLSLCWLSFPLC